MDLIKAQRLLIKIQAFLDNGNGNELSRLEKDLMKSYVIQLYDAMSSEEPLVHTEKPKQVELPVARIQKPESPPVKIIEPPGQELEKTVFVPVMPQAEENPVHVKQPVSEDQVILTTKPEPQKAIKPDVKPVRDAAQTVKTTPVEVMDVLSRLFESPNVDDVSGRFSHIPIANIESALGLNERIFTLNELFGGNRGLFEATCAELNNLSSYDEATTILLKGPARQYNWADPERIKMAEHFIRIVSRRYPKA